MLPTTISCTRTDRVAGDCDIDIETETAIIAITMKLEQQQIETICVSIGYDSNRIEMKCWSFEKAKVLIVHQLRKTAKNKQTEIFVQ